VAKSADQDYATAEYVIAFMYYSGQGTAANKSEAAKWMLKAAAHGSDPSLIVVRKGRAARLGALWA
jgi:TPR repeat protein